MDRQSIQAQYDFVFTDNQWSILLQELEGKEDWESDDEVIQNTITDIDYLEELYAWWEDQLAQAQQRKQQKP